MSNFLLSHGPPTPRDSSIRYEIPLYLACVPMTKPFQRYPEAQEQPSTTGIKTGADENAMIYYHRVGTDQCMSISSMSNGYNLIHR